MQLEWDDDRDGRMKVAITGVSGFIGRYLLRELQHYPVDVVAITRNAKRLGNMPAQIRVVEFDLGNYSGDPFKLLGSPDLLIHLAWDELGDYRSHSHTDLQLPLHYHFLQQMVQSGLPALFVAGTCFEYGLQEGALREDALTKPVLPYGIAKDALRQQLQRLQSEFPFQLTWGRLFYMYGEEQASKSLYPLLMAAIKEGAPIFNMSGGEQLRDYLPVERVVKLIARLALKRLNAGPVNICSGEPISVRQLVEGWIESANAQIALNLGHYPYPDYEPMAFWGDRSLLERLLK